LEPSAERLLTPALVWQATQYLTPAATAGGAANVNSSQWPELVEEKAFS
jgi:hypothetical protein